MRAKFFRAKGYKQEKAGGQNKFCCIRVESEISILIHNRAYIYRQIRNKYEWMSRHKLLYIHMFSSTIY